MTDLRELYQEIILDHAKNPRHKGTMDTATHQAEGHNPLCGDEVTMFLRMEGDRVADLSFEGSGCAISTATASMLVEQLKGKTTAEIRAAIERIHDAVVRESPTDIDQLGSLQALMSLKDYPMRVKCATLSMHTILAALDQSEDKVVTE